MNLKFNAETNLPTALIIETLTLSNKRVFSQQSTASVLSSLFLI